VAIAFDPSSWRNIVCHLLLLFSDNAIGSRRRRSVAVCEWAVEALANGAHDGIKGHDTAESSQASEKYGIGDRAAEVLQGQFGGRNNRQAVPAQATGQLCEAQLLEAMSRVDQKIAVGPESAEEVDLVQERRILDYYRVWSHYGRMGADLGIAYPAERHDRCARALGAEARECLSKPTLQEGRD